MPLWSWWKSKADVYVNASKRRGEREQIEEGREKPRHALIFYRPTNSVFRFSLLSLSLEGERGGE